MTVQPENWEAIKALFDAALEEDSAHRSLFLKERCPDASLRAEVERLLAEHDQAGSFLSAPAIGKLGSVQEPALPTRNLAEGNLLTGKRIGSYTVLRRLGAGGMGIVFRVADEAGRPFAIKMIGSHAAIQATLHIDKALQNASALDLDARMRLVREARLAMGLVHPNIIKTFDYGQHGGLLYIVVEYLRGRSLDKVIPIHSSVPLSAKLKIIRQICEALEYAHLQGVMHRDVKPHNTFLLPDANVKVLDFGLAARLREPLPGQIAIVGTPNYMAPEVVGASHVYDGKVDIWSTGVTLYQLLIGRLPFNAPSISQLFNEIVHAPFPRIDPNLPHAIQLERILGLALAKNPLERYATAGDFARDLRRLEEEIADRRSLPAGHSKAIDDDPWWASTIVQVAASPAIGLDPPSETVSMVSGNISARRPGHTMRFVEYNENTMGIFLACILIASPYMLIGMLTGGHDFLSSVLSSVLGPPFMWAGVSYLAGFGAPALFAISIALSLPIYWEKFAEIPRCRSCRRWMKHRSRVTRFAYSRESWAHASSDCLAALKANLWQDAARLLYLHGEGIAPEPGDKTSWPLIQYHLDFFGCETCGAESALLTTEDRMGRTWNAREEYEGAYKTKGRVGTKPSLLGHKYGILSAVHRAAQLAAEPVVPVARIVLLIPALFTAIYYYPQIPLLLGLPGYKASITITSNPTGQSILVDGQLISTPRTFLWAYDSVHTIAKLDKRLIKGNVYQFIEITPNVDIGEQHRNGLESVGGWLRMERTVGISAAIDGWGRPANRPMVPTFTVVFSQVSPVPGNEQGPLGARRVER